MKEFAIKHPWMTFFAITSIIDATIKIVYLVTKGGTKTVKVEKEETVNESSDNAE